ncbi:hypothetical protein F4678DRAFT_465826 [Xylaria arbuscula]|nr:hypothetical protein F4678DRAFT_465826 [Xylaria arbuscula]
MAAILSFILDAVGIASFGLFASQLKKGNEDANSMTYVEVVIGSGDPTMAGAMPNIAIWNEDGERLGQYKRSSRKVKEGQDEVISITHNEGAHRAEQATYIMLSNPDDDAVCISGIYITDTKVNTVFFGDVGKLCGMSWGISNRDVGDEHTRPKCVWLDGDGTNGINAQAMSFHIPDVVANPDRLQQYKERQDTLCKSTPRFSFWGNLSPQSVIPFFEPPLEYETDSSNGGLGADKDLKRVLDKDGEFDKSVVLYEKGNTKHRRSGGSVLDIPPSTHVPKATKKAKRSPRPESLIVTPFPDHSARELCLSETSWGSDTVSLTERLFCDMEAKILYPLCDDGIILTCFDLATEKLIPAGNITTIPRPGNATHWKSDIQSRKVPAPKVYSSTAYW